MGLRSRRKQDEELIEGEPSMLGRARREQQGVGDEVAPHPGADDQDAPQSGADDQEAAVQGDDADAELQGGVIRTGPEPDEGDFGPPVDTAESPRSPDVRDEIERLARQIRGLQQQFEELLQRRNDAAASQAGQRVAAIVQAAEESAADISAQAHREATELRDRLLAEAQAEADRLRAEAQADAASIRTEAHAAASRLREETLAEVRREVDRACAQLAEQLQISGREAIDRVVGAPAPSVPRETRSEPGPPDDESGEEPDADVEEAVDELHSAAAVLERSLRHLQELGQELPEGQ